MPQEQAASCAVTAQWIRSTRRRCGRLQVRFFMFRWSQGWTDERRVAGGTRVRTSRCGLRGGVPHTDVDWSSFGPRSRKRGRRV